MTEVDKDGKQVSDGFRKAPGELGVSGALHRNLSEAMGGSLGGDFSTNLMTRMLGQPIPRNALVSQLAPEVSRQLQVGPMVQLQQDGPSSLGPNQQTSVAYRDEVRKSQLRFVVESLATGCDRLGSLGASWNQKDDAYLTGEFTRGMCKLSLHMCDGWGGLSAGGS